MPGIFQLTAGRNSLGLFARLQSLAYRIIRKALHLHVYHMVAIDTTFAVPIKDRQTEYRFLKSDEIERFVGEADNDLDENIHRRLVSGLDSCFAAISGGKLLGYCWYATDSIEAQHAGGLPLSFPPTCAYFYKAYTHPNYRGRSINQTVILSALEEFAKRGVERVFGFVEINNWSSLRSCDRTGFRRIGRLVALGRGTAKLVWMPREAATIGIRYGGEAVVKPRTA